MEERFRQGRRRDENLLCYNQSKVCHNTHTDLRKGVDWLLTEYKKKANQWLIVGFVVWFAGNVLKGLADGQSLQFFLGYALFLLGYSLFIFGCINYSKAKGYHWVVGLLGMLNIIGLVILAVLPDKHKVGKVREQV